ncbi:hypothetical protein CU663_26905 [Pseudomonas syringae pv. actinidifoliorum]|nr:hypothetical protein [Pseudomonas syringae pv. actinidifoliorum]
MIERHSSVRRIGVMHPLRTSAAAPITVGIDDGVGSINVDTSAKSSGEKPGVNDCQGITVSCP